LRHEKTLLTLLTLCEAYSFSGFGMTMMPSQRVGKHFAQVAKVRRVMRSERMGAM
jgi:hypothetical protein